jgi:hypothetical protein
VCSTCGDCKLFSVDIWASTYGDNLFVRRILPNRLTGGNYKALSENFMYDGTAAYFRLIASWYLNRNFLGQWLDTDGPGRPHSPGLNPLDFYLWDRLKLLVYSQRCGNSPNLNCGRFSDNTQHARWQ